MKVRVGHFLKIVLVLGSFFAVFTSFSQNKKQLINYADIAFSEKDYYGAANYYKQALLIDEENIAVKYKLAESYRLYNEYTLAERLFADILQKDRGENFPECIFWLAMMQKSNGKYELAKKTFENGLKLNKYSINSYFSIKTRKEIESCLYALKTPKSDSTIISHLPSNINSIHSEFSPFLNNKNELYFSSVRTLNDSSSLIDVSNPEYKISIFSSKKSADNWEDPKKLSSALINNPLFNNANFSLSADKTIAFFSRDNDEGKFEIYYSILKDEKWLDPVKLPETINLPGYISTQPFITEYKGKELLFFVTDRPGGQGKLDIWYSIIRKTNNDYQFKTPMPLGPNVNSIDNEITPYYDLEKEILYFSSDWHNGFGGYDIFYSLGYPDHLSLPENFGPDINSPANDYYFYPAESSIYKNKLSGIFASNRKGSNTAKGETCCNDLYLVEHIISESINENSFSSNETKLNVDLNSTPEQIIEIKKEETTHLKKINSFLPLSLYFHNDEPDPKTTRINSKNNYINTYNEYIKLIPKYEKEYSLGLEEKSAKEAVLDISAFFDEFVKKGYSDLEGFSTTLQELLETGLEIKLLVSGFASPLAQSDYNVNLSKRRISTFINHLSEFNKGILLKYLKNGQLKINQEPNGEFEAGKLVSDNLNDQKNSIYSRSAALERKIEVKLMAISSLNKNTQEEVNPTNQELKENQNNIDPPSYLLPQTSHNFGTVKYGEKVSHTFKIKNSGNSDLIIYNAIGSCGCTVPDWNKEPIKPGEQGEITVTFDSKGKFGKTTTSITLLTNGQPKTRTINISADVIIQK